MKEVDETPSDVSSLLLRSLEGGDASADHLCHARRSPDAIHELLWPIIFDDAGICAVQFGGEPSIVVV